LDVVQAQHCVRNYPFSPLGGAADSNITAQTLCSANSINIQLMLQEFGALDNDSTNHPNVQVQVGGTTLILF
jgi:hypothetical protein